MSSHQQNEMIPSASSSSSESNGKHSSSEEAEYPRLKGHLLDRKKMKSIEDIDNCTDYKYLILHEKYTTVESVPQKVMDILKEHEAGDLTQQTRELTYDHLTYNEVLSTFVPSGLEITSSFEQVGHVAHLNIPDEVLKYKYLISQVMLDKNPTLKTVVNKIGMIDSVFREFKMELLCGEDNFNVTVKENGITFKFNYREVYWNSRLGTEHTRLLSFFDKSQVVCDMMAGVGPFAVPAAKKVRCRVLANDLNPKSYEYMKENAIINKVTDNMECSAKDGDDLQELSKQQVEQVIGQDHVMEYVDIHHVRNVAPRKEMMCVSFRLKQPHQNAPTTSPLKRKQEEISPSEEHQEDKSSNNNIHHIVGSSLVSSFSSLQQDIEWLF
ncbi:hypothetical protein FDP41_006963 [Naegleria fowleri]|uniref:tRNA (guanine(37)-N1)-methyltransferase n=1 Tax=Naegleria fowleri TaxID=5763 RepID=A0A6A5BGU4_NAEFO|nr:uncharacterized protein FDP41_006963 [Naegleria fowleri]KAF0974032.1 hypothetical protein FDP41_006963 [Naegleria fowleri]